MKLRLGIFALIAGAAAAAPAFSKDFDQDSQVWTALMAQGPIGPSVHAYLEVQPRFGLDSNGLPQLLIRPAVYFPLDPKLSIWVGYAYVNQNSPVSLRENRFWQQALYADTYDMFRLSHRLRMEQRFFSTSASSGNGDAGFRARYQIRSLHPLHKSRKTNLVIQDEIFVNLNATLGQRAGLDQNRFMLGVNHELDPALAFDVGYLGQYIRQPLLPRDRYRHAFVLNAYLYW